MNTQPIAWHYQVVDTPRYPGDSMREVVWTAEDAERQRQRGYEVTPMYPSPSRDVADEAMVERIEAVRQEAIRAWEKEVGVLVSMNRQEACRVGMRAALQAAALPAVPDGEKWHITEAWIHGGTVAELKLQRRFRGEDKAEVTDLCGQYVRLAATPAHDQPEGKGDA